MPQKLKSILSKLWIAFVHFFYWAINLSFIALLLSAFSSFMYSFTMYGFSNYLNYGISTPAIKMGWENLINYTSILMALPIIVLMPFAALIFVVVVVYIKKHYEISLAKLLFGIELPMMLLAGFTFFAGWFNIGSILIMFVFYTYVFVKLLRLIKSNSVLDMFSKALNVMAAVISVYFMAVVLFPVAYFIIITFNITMYVDGIRSVLTSYMYAPFNSSYRYGFESFSMLSVMLFWAVSFVLVGAFVFITPIVSSIRTIVNDIRDVILGKKLREGIAMGLSGVLIVLLMVLTGYFNQHYRPNIGSFDNSEVVKLISTQDYQEKRDLKKLIAKKYGAQEFINLVMTGDKYKTPDYYNDDGPFSYYADASSITNSIIDSNTSGSCFRSQGALDGVACKRVYMFMEKFSVVYKHLLSFLMPTEQESSRSAYSQLFYKSVYDTNSYDSCYYSSYGGCYSVVGSDYPYTSPTIWGTVELRDIGEKMVQEKAGVTSSTVSLSLYNPSSSITSIELQFDLPKDSIITGLYVGDEQVAAQLVPQNVAEKIYMEEFSKYVPTDPTVLSRIVGDKYRLRVYPVPQFTVYDIRFTYITLSNSEIGARIIGGSGLKLGSNGDLWLDTPISVFQNKFEENKELVKEQNGDTKDMYYVDNNETSLSGILSADVLDEVISTEEFKQVPIVLALDLSYSMRRAESSVVAKYRDLYTSLKNDGREVVIYGFDSGYFKLSEDDLNKLTEDDLVGYSNRVLALNQLFQDEALAGKKWHLVIFTDNSIDYAFQDSTYEDNNAEIVNGIAVPNTVQILTTKVFVVDNGDGHGLANVNTVSQDLVAFVSNMHGDIYFGSNYPQDWSRDLDQAALIDLLPKSINIGEKDFKIDNVWLIANNSRLAFNVGSNSMNAVGVDLKSLVGVDRIQSDVRFSIGNKTVQLVKCDDCKYVKQLVDYAHATELASAFNYKSSNEQRIRTGDAIYAIGLENNMMVPYTSYIYLETEEQQESLDLEMNSEDKYDSTADKMSPNLVSTGVKDMRALAGIIFIGSVVVLIVLRRRKELEA